MLVNKKKNEKYKNKNAQPNYRRNCVCIAEQVIDIYENSQKVLREKNNIRLPYNLQLYVSASTSHVANRVYLM